MLSKYFQKKLFFSFARPNNLYKYIYSKFSSHANLLISLRSSPDDFSIYQKICEYVNSPELVQNTSKLEIFLDFYQEMRLAQKEKLNSFAFSFQKLIFQGLSIKNIPENYLILLIDFIFNYPFVLKDNKSFFNALDSILLHRFENFEKKMNSNIYINVLLQFSVISANRNQGSLRLIKTIENEFINIDNFSDSSDILSFKLLAEVVLAGARNMGFFSKEFLMKVCNYLLKFQYQEKLDKEKIIDVIYAFSLLNINLSPLYENGFNTVIINILIFKFIGFS
jgi:hypothetical protein